MAEPSPLLAEGRRACLESWAIGSNGQPPAAGAWSLPARAVSTLPWAVASFFARSPWAMAAAVTALGLVAGMAVGVVGSGHGRR